MINNIFWLVFILFIWFDTDAFVWWFERFKIFKIKEYKSYKEDMDMDISYPDWLFLNNSTFLKKIISCPPCLLFWICIPFGLYLFPINYIMSYIIYKLINKYLN
jgi:hypothetical protein